VQSKRQLVQVLLQHSLKPCVPVPFQSLPATKSLAALAPAAAQPVPAFPSTATKPLTTLASAATQVNVRVLRCRLHSVWQEGDDCR